MDTRQFVELSESDWRRCATWVRQVLLPALREQKSAGNAAAARLTSHDIDEEMQTRAKAAEVAFCLVVGLHPDCLDWRGEPTEIDVYFDDKKIDVKHTARGQYLSYPYNKRLGPTKTLDTFVLVRGVYRRMEIAGWCSRHFFESNCRETHEAGMYSMTKGTKILHQSKLRDLQELVGVSYSKPQHVPQSTWDAFVWVRKFHPERLPKWLNEHPGMQHKVAA